MSLIYSCDSRLIETALRKLKADGLVSPDAYFNHHAPANLRKEVAYRDSDFLSRLSREAEGEIVSSVLGWLKRKNLVSESAAYDEEAFSELRQEELQRKRLV